MAESYGNSMLNILRNHQTFPQKLRHFTLLPAVHEGSDCSASSPALSLF